MAVAPGRVTGSLRGAGTKAVLRALLHRYRIEIRIGPGQASEPGDVTIKDARRAAV